jgi:glycosyltransferase involved in cell wall biosynthesis
MEKPLRILYVNNINQVAEVFAHELQRRGHSTELFQPSLLGGFAPMPIKLALMPMRVLDMGRISGKLNAEHFDIMHIHWASYGVLGSLSSIPYVVHCHGSDIRERLNQPFFRPVLTSILRRAASVLCITPDLLPVIRSVRQNVIFSPAPIDTDRFIPCQGGQPLSQGCWTILLFARLDPEKGIDVALQGITRFVRRHTDVRVQLLNWGPLKKVYRYRYGERFEFLPLVAPDKVHHLIQAADVIVGQFALGALGLSELQSMSCAKPVIASFCYGDAYPTPPPLFQATTAEEVDEHLENIFLHPEVGMAIGREAREWVIKYHCYRNLAANLERLYQTIV